MTALSILRSIDKKESDFNYLCKLEKDNIITIQNIIQINNN